MGRRLSYQQILYKEIDQSYRSAARLTDSCACTPSLLPSTTMAEIHDQFDTILINPPPGMNFLLGHLESEQDPQMTYQL